MSGKLLLLIIFLFIAIGLFSKHLYHLEHTQVEISVLAFKDGCSPEVFVKVKKLGIENVVSSCLKQKEVLQINCTSEKLHTNVTLLPVCLNTSGEKYWILNLYGKHTLSELPKIELINKTIE